MNEKDGRCDPEDIPLIAHGQIAAEDALARHTDAGRCLLITTRPLREFDGTSASVESPVRWDAEFREAHESLMNLSRQESSPRHRASMEIIEADAHALAGLFQLDTPNT